MQERADTSGTLLTQAVLTTFLTPKAPPGARPSGAIEKYDGSMRQIGAGSLRSDFDVRSLSRPPDAGDPDYLAGRVTGWANDEALFRF
jgi:hypothetical protein